jgi:hypothetical protein
MSGRLSSPRFRRRLFWSAGTLGLLSALTATAILIGNTGRSNETPITNKPAWVYHEPQRLTLTPADRRELFEIATRFVRSAVARKHLDTAWRMLGPEMRAGQTQRSWNTGFNNVIPFPAIGIANWDIAYAYKDDVGIDLAVVGAKTSDWAGKTFTIELKRYKSHPSDWLVAAWVPKGVGGSEQIRSVAAQPPPPAVKAAVSAKWLLVPLATLGTLVLLLITWGVHGSIKQRQAAKRFAEALGYSSTSNPS